MGSGGCVSHRCTPPPPPPPPHLIAGFDRAPGGRLLCTDGGDAGAKGGEGSVKELTDLKRQKQKLEEENNMLKYKMEVLIGASNP